MTRKTTYKWLLGLGLCAALVVGLTTAQAATVVAPGSGTAAVMRTHGDHTYAVTYTVVKGADAAAIKFEDAVRGGEEDCLGEDKAGETDTFVIAVEGAGDSITVETKASTSTATTIVSTSVIGEGDSHRDGNGFRIALVSIEDGIYTLRVTSERPPHALSHVTFTFSEGQHADAAYD